MNKIYQPDIIKKTDEIVNILNESGFFKDYEIDSMEYSRTYFLDKLTEKFIIGECNINEDELFTEDEFERCLMEIVTGSLLYSLKEKGYVNSYEDENTEEVFFLTEEGKKHVNELGIKPPIKDLLT